MQETTCKRTGHQILWDGQTVWVNSCEDGSSIARFSRVSVDIHKSATEQIATGDQCLACFHVEYPSHAWNKFIRLLFEYYGVEAPEAARPAYAKDDCLDVDACAAGDVCRNCYNASAGIPERVCSTCQGTGRLWGGNVGPRAHLPEDCYDCNGSGHTTKEEQ